MDQDETWRGQTAGCIRMPLGAEVGLGPGHIVSERELTFTLAICCLSSVTFVQPTQAVEIFGNISMALGTLAIH